MTNLQNLIDQAKKELVENGFTSTTRTLGLEAFLEAQIRLAYREGAEGMKDEVVASTYRNILLSVQNESITTGRAMELLEADCEAFLSTLTDV